MKKRIIYTILLCVVFIGGIAVGFYKVFPLPQILAWKQYAEYKPGTFEPKGKIEPLSPVKVYNTFLERLLIKRIHINGYAGHGGGISASGNLLYLVTNKGSVRTYDLKTHTIVANNISRVPMNIIGLVKSTHPYRHDFHMGWFRVSGIYSELINDQTSVLYVSHNAYDADKDCITFNVSRIKLKLSNRKVSPLSNWQTIFTASPCIDPTPQVRRPNSSLYSGNISGGVITNFDKNHLLVTVGDFDRNGMFGTSEWAINASNPYGKVIKLNKKSGRWSIFTRGNRNVTGVYMASDSVIWAVENGPRGGDELNILTKDANYGWPEVSYGIWYDLTTKLPGGYKSGTYPRYKKPDFSWVPSVAPRGLVKIEGAKFNYWKGDLLMGTMRDQSLHRLRLDEKNRVVYDERIYLGHRIRDLTKLPDGKIALLTDDGYLMIIDDGGPIFREMDSDAKERMASLERFDQFATGDSMYHEAEIYKNTAKTIFQQKCATCHNLGVSNGIGPNLHALFKRKVGAVEKFDYSQDLKMDTATWNPKLLRSFLKDPQKKLPGTHMPKINLSSGQIDSLIFFFQNQDSTESRIK